MKKFRFSLGDTNTGAVGLAFSVEAKTKKQAVTIARRKLRGLLDGTEVRVFDSFTDNPHGEVLFVNSQNITEANIADVQDIKD